MRRPALLLVLLLAACSGSSPSTLRSPSPPGPTSAAPVPAATTARPTPSLTPSPTPAARLRGTPTPSPTARRTGSPAPSATPRASRTPSASPRPAGKTYGVAQVTGDRFSPSSLTLRVGDWVLVTDQDAIAPHTFTITALHADSGGMSQGDTYRYRFAEPGTFDFVCTYHEGVGMTGTVTVRP